MACLDDGAKVVEQGLHLAPLNIAFGRFVKDRFQDSPVFVTHDPASYRWGITLGRLAMPVRKGKYGEGLPCRTSRRLAKPCGTNEGILALAGLPSNLRSV
ncbi:hypothetical protein ebA51 [Aromatoleum aromaticum EbN1]|uniref:Uncharacterized protein n=1 Tax=Aromatoleum aromaticum (strain DSM 19018 / LMG 30748 / EbN1) TaxID=76114 RepID=Q5P960_AROAE|nr:hypothetical protein ebA51 [Aromatoleum aromaticum EbN1]